MKLRKQFPRDDVMYAAVFGLFGFSWFGWAQESPPEQWRVALGIASATCFIIACVGGFLAAKHWRAASALNRPGMYQRFGVIVAIEIAFCLVGALLLAYNHLSQYTASYISFVVAAHFIPLRPLFQDRSLYVLAGLVILVAASSVVLSSALGLTATTITTIGAGVLLFLFAVRGLVLFFSAKP